MKIEEHIKKMLVIGGVGCRSQGKLPNGIDDTHYNVHLMKVAGSK